MVERGGGGTQVIILKVGERELTRVVLDGLKRYSGSNGDPLAGFS